MDKEEEKIHEEEDEFGSDEGFNKDDLKCRFYRNEYPEKGDIVVVKIIKVSDEGAYVNLLEYNECEALILAANTTRKRIRNVKKLLRIGTEDYMQVTAVDTTNGKGFVDLSKKTVQPSDCEEKKVEFNKAKIANLILRLTAFNLKVKLIDLYEDFGWDLQEQFGNLHDAFKLSLNDPDMVFSKVDITDEQKTELMKSIQKKMSVAPTKIRTLFNLKCYTYEGIEAIRESLLEAKRQTSDDQFKLIFQLIKPPEYKAEVVTLDKQGGTERLEKALAIVSKEIKARGGIYKLVEPPTRIGRKKDGADDEDILAQYQKNLEEEEDSSENENNEEGIDFDLNEDGIDIAEEDDDEEESKA